MKALRMVTTTDRRAVQDVARALEDAARSVGLEPQTVRVGHAIDAAETRATVELIVSRRDLRDIDAASARLELILGRRVSISPSD